jgi:hypothetical protein
MVFLHPLSHQFHTALVYRRDHNEAFWTVSSAVRSKWREVPLLPG